MLGRTSHRSFFLALALALTVAGCTSPSKPNAPVVESDDLRASGSTSAVSVVGLVDELASVLGAPEGTGQSKVDGVIAVATAFGIDRVTLMGEVSGGYPTPNPAPSLVVNGVTAGAISVEIDGVSATKLFDAMVRGTTSTTAEGFTERRSRTGRIRCVKYDADAHHCTLHDLVGIGRGAPGSSGPTDGVTTSMMATVGLRDDLARVTGLSMSGVAIDGALKVHPGFGVDLVEVEGGFSAGYLVSFPSGISTATVGGQTVGALTLGLQGSSAKALFEAMTLAESTFDKIGVEIRHSASGRVVCVKFVTDAPHQCGVTGFVGFGT